MRPEDVIEVVSQIDPYLSVHTEVQLADYGESANGGPYVKLRLGDAGELEPFRGQDRAAKNKAGKRYILLLIEVGDDERPVEQPVVEDRKGGPLSKRAARLCMEDEFAKFVSVSSPTMWRDAVSNDIATALICREYILGVCGIESRVDLDHNDRAAHVFQRSVLGPYLRWQQEVAA